MKIIALIPARGQSKSIPEKNIQPLKGIPLIAHSIKTSLSVKRIERTIVTTDSEEIAEVARKYGAEVPFMRPESLSGDFSLDHEYHLHAVEELAKAGYRPDVIVNFRPTQPLRRSELIERALDAFLADSEADCLRSVRRAEQTPYKMWFQKGHYLTPVLGSIEEDFFNRPRQKLPQALWQDGYVDMVRVAALLKYRTTTGRKIMPFLIEENTPDIDYADQLKKAEDYEPGSGRAPRYSS